MGTTTIVEMTLPQARAELEVLEDQLGMPTESAEELAAANALDPSQFTLLRRIEDLRWLTAE